MALSIVQDEKPHCQATPVRAAARLASEVLSSWRYVL